MEDDESKTIGFERLIMTISTDFEDIKTIKDLERVSKGAVWQNFEVLVGFIFEANDFQVIINKVKTFNKKRRQYDVIAKKNDITYLIECKKWAGNRYRLSALKKAIEKHKERTEFYSNLTEENSIPVIVTFIEEDIKFYEDMPIIPISRLNSFINEVDRDAITISDDIGPKT
jgi:Holliday junction resolvase